MEVINPIVFSPSMLVSSSVAETDHPLWSTGVYGVGDKVRLDATHHRYECAVPHTTVAASASATVTITQATPAVVTWTAHGLSDGAEIIFTSNGLLPAGLTAGQKYYVSSPTANTFNVVAVRGSTSLVATTSAGTGTHKASVTSTSPDVNSDKWIDLGATNRHAMFDDKFGTQTISTGSLVVKVKPGVAIDSLALLNMRGASVTVSCSVGGSVIYTSTKSLISGRNVYDLKTYFFAPILYERDLVFTDLLPYGQQEITITVTGPETVAIGNLSMGQKIELGKLQYSPKFGITSYSKDEEDQWGNMSIKRGPYAKRFSGTLIVKNDFIDQLSGILISLRDVPAVWIGAGDKYGALIVWGRLKEHEFSLDYSTISFCSFSIKGLT